MNALITQLQAGSNKDYLVKIACLQGITQVGMKIGKNAFSVNFMPILLQFLSN